MKAGKKKTTNSAGEVEILNLISTAGLDLLMLMLMLMPRLMLMVMPRLMPMLVLMLMLMPILLLTANVAMALC
jgi:hypothetical protein